ncbi:hypothetical protein ZWY2020_018009 [Hordeum vulgare]|nr:hypothetical protein ZWY2020_018009 [Hordeum vulgare]
MACSLSRLAIAVSARCTLHVRVLGFTTSRGSGVPGVSFHWEAASAGGGAGCVALIGGLGRCAAHLHPPALRICDVPTAEKGRPQAEDRDRRTCGLWAVADRCVWTAGFSLAPCLDGRMGRV